LKETGRDTQVWPVLLLLFAVLVPAVCLLWFMAAAMRNERLAARQRLAEAYQIQLASYREQLDASFTDLQSKIEKLGRISPPSGAFAKCVLEAGVETVLIRDGQGAVLYPNTSAQVQERFLASEREWAQANHLEYFRKDYRAAAKAYSTIAQGSSNVNFTARALQAQARCLVQAEEASSAIPLINEQLGKEEFHHAVDPQGRLIAANAELMLLELMTNHTALEWGSTAQRLKERLLDYGDSAMAAPQRRFLMKELRSLSPGIEFPTLGAEELAAEFTHSHAAQFADSGLHQTAFADLWGFATADHRVIALLGRKHLERLLQAALSREKLPADTALHLLAPGQENRPAFVSITAGDRLPGWRLALTLQSEALFNAVTRNRTNFYLLTGLFVAGGMSVLALLALRLLRRQMAVAQLKNDLVATVSHELKTPLASMRVLVDTLLEADDLKQETAREYLSLIARENERLSRLIQNFLAFSRMERKKYSFHFTTVPARKIVEAAAEAVRERFDTPGCRFKVEMETSLPAINADEDALMTALLNLLDNAFKYSGENKHILLRASAEGRQVLLSVRDNGIGIASREKQKIFQDFYQVDQRLSREGGGCGLGLAIVQFIVSAHRGSVKVESEPDSGSTFSISVPAVSVPVSASKELVI
jgi:signal transduction histidine kinase